MPDSPQQCTMCPNTTTNRCKACKSSAYCSKDCQKADWPTHKILCASFSSFTTPPSPEHRLGILLPADSPIPRFIWVSCELVFDEGEGVLWQYAECPELGFSPELSVEMLGNSLRKRWREDKLKMYYKDDFLIDGSPFNMCIPAITGGKAAYPWAASLLIMRQPGHELDTGAYLNVEMVDFRDAVDLLVSYPGSTSGLLDMTGIPRPT